MRNQQIKKVNRVFFSGQDADKRKWLEQMAAEGWHLISVNSIVFTFQRVSSVLNENQHSFKSLLGKDFQRSMPLYQESNEEGYALLPERRADKINFTPSLLPVLVDSKNGNMTKRHTYQSGALAIIFLLIVLSTKAALFSTGDLVSLFKLHFVTNVLYIGFCITLAGTILLKSLLKSTSAEQKK